MASKPFKSRRDRRSRSHPAPSLRLDERYIPAILEDLVRAGEWRQHGDQGEPCRGRLGLDQFPPDGGPHHPVERLVERDQEADDLKIGLPVKDMERPDTILAGTSGEQVFGSGARHHRLRYEVTNFSKSVSSESRNLSRLIPLRLKV
jgi:hypothetical protein